MSEKKVDVLGIIRRDIFHAEAYRIEHGYIDGSLADAVYEARDSVAIVAELIDAARKLYIVTAGLQRDIDANERMALAATLARIGREP